MKQNEPKKLTTWLIFVILDMILAVGLMISAIDNPAWVPVNLFYIIIAFHYLSDYRKHL